MFLWADVVIGAVDNREARVFINSACARTRRTWVDGAIEGLSGIVRVFAPHRGACYECTMNSTDRKLLAERRSCALLARDLVLQGRVPTSAVAASIIGAMQVQEAIKAVHGQPTLAGADPPLASAAKSLRIDAAWPCMILPMLPETLLYTARALSS